jgi:hypothetical protein
MSAILYYSTYCQHCNHLINYCSRLNITNQLHFLCVDRRVKRGQQEFILLDNGTEILMPSAIRSVPSLLLLNYGNKILEGDQIKEFIDSKIAQTQQYQVPLTQQNGLQNSGQGNSGNMGPTSEPDAFSLGGLGSVVSDQYSFLDQSADELSAKGNGGTRQMYNYATINQFDSIETPPDDYVPNKVGNMSLDQIRAMREQDVPRQQQRI